MHLKGCTIGEPTSCILSTAHFSQHCRALVWCVRIGCQSTSCKVGRSPFWGVLYWVWPICSGTSVDWDDYPLVIWHSYRKLSIFKRVMIYVKNMIFQDLSWSITDAGRASSVSLSNKLTFFWLSHVCCFCILSIDLSSHLVGGFIFYFP